MKPLISILILVSFSSFPVIISGASTTEERRRAATVSAVKHQDPEFPPQLLRLIASNGHVSRDSEQLEMGFFPQNEWKALKRVFKRTERAAAIHNMISRYDDARSAPKIEYLNRAEQYHWRKDEEEHGKVSITIQPGTGLPAMILNEDHEIIKLGFPPLNGKDLGDLSYLPPNLRHLVIYDGNLPNFEFSKLPKRLRWLIHPGPAAESKLHVRSLPPRLETFRLREGGYRRDEDPLEVHFYLPLPQGLEVYAPRMDGFVYHPEPAEINKIKGERRWDDIWEVKWDDGSQIKVVVY